MTQQKEQREMMAIRIATEDQAKPTKAYSYTNKVNLFVKDIK